MNTAIVVALLMVMYVNPATAVQVAALVPAAEVHQNAPMVIINAMEIHHTDVPAVVGFTMIPVTTAAIIQQANATAVQAAAPVQAAEALQNAIMVSIVVPTVILRGAAAENG